MPKLDFTFSGWVRGARIETVTVTATGATLDVSKMAAKRVATNLESGEWSISLGDYLYDNNEAEIDISDFDECRIF